MLWGIIVAVILSGISLAMDAFAVSICDGMVYRNLTKGKAVIMPTVFGVFQAVMPIIGFYIGMAFSQIDAFDKVDHWIAFALLFIIGGKMIYDGIKELRAKEEELKIKQFSLPEVLVQGVATSIDALFVGFSLNTMLEEVTTLDVLNSVQAWAWISVSIIGVITFVISLIGVIIGVKVGQLFRKKACIAEIIGGVVLIGIALKILIEGLL